MEAAEQHPPAGQAAGAGPEKEPNSPADPADPAKPPPLPNVRRFFMPPPPRSVAEAVPGKTGEGFSLAAAIESSAALQPAAAIVINPVEPRRRRRSDTSLLIAILVALAVIAVGLGVVVLFG